MNVDIGLDNSRSTAQVVELAVTAESHGVDTIWIAEQHFRRGVISMVAAAATRTQRINFGFGVLSPFVRHPAMVSMEVANLVEHFGNRFKLGYGVAHGGAAALERMPRTPLEGLKEAGLITRTLLAGERVRSNWNHFPIGKAGLKVDPAAVTVRLYLGTVGAKSTAMATAVYDGVLLGVLCSKDFIRRRAGDVERGLELNGRARDTFEIGCLVLTSLSNDREEALDAVRRAIAYYLPLVPNLEERAFGTGFSSNMLRRLREKVVDAQNTTGPRSAAALIPDDLVDALAIAGQQGEVRKRIKDFSSLGIDRVVAHHGIEPGMVSGLTGEPSLNGDRS